jgi:hypothetical protein
MEGSREGGRKGDGGRWKDRGTKGDEIQKEGVRDEFMGIDRDTRGREKERGRK